MHFVQSLNRHDMASHMIWMSVCKSCDKVCCMVRYGIWYRQSHKVHELLLLPTILPKVLLPVIIVCLSPHTWTGSCLPPTSRLPIITFFLPYIHTYIHTSIRPYVHTSIRPYIHTSIHPYIHTSIHPYIHTSIHPYIHTSIHHTSYILVRHHCHRYVCMYIRCHTYHTYSDHTYYYVVCKRGQLMWYCMYVISRFHNYFCEAFYPSSTIQLCLSCPLLAVALPSSF